MIELGSKAGVCPLAGTYECGHDFSGADNAGVMVCYLADRCPLLQSLAVRSFLQQGETSTAQDRGLEERNYL